MQGDGRECFGARACRDRDVALGSEEGLEELAVVDLIIDDENRAGCSGRVGHIWLLWGNGVGLLSGRSPLIAA